MTTTTHLLSESGNLPPEFHALEREFGSPERYGFPVPVPPQAMILMGKTICAVAGADGEVTPKEFNRLIGRGTMFGMTAEQTQELREFDYENANLDTLLSAVPPPARTVVLWEAIQVARADGFGDKERSAAQRAAQRLGLPDNFVAAVERNLEAEDRLREERLRILSSANS